MNEGHLRQEICNHGASIHNRGVTHGATGNISARLDDGWLMTPTRSNLVDLDPDRLSRLDGNGVHTGGDAPTKESFLHLAVYGQWANSGTVVHLHSTIRSPFPCWRTWTRATCCRPSPPGTSTPS